jgi:ferredoxin
VKVTVDADVCTGHGRCYVLGPDVFSPDDFGHCLVLRADVPPELEHQARTAAESCPERAITVVDD